jgi:hypothetical protein
LNKLLTSLDYVRLFASGNAGEQPVAGGNNHKLMTVLSLAQIAPLTVINRMSKFLAGGNHITPSHLLKTHS